MEPSQLDPWQFRLVRGNRDGAPMVGAFHLDVGPGLPVIPLVTQSGEPAGCLLGFAIDIVQRALPSGPLALPQAVTPQEMVRKLLSRLGGRYLLIVDLPGFQRIYPDVSAQVSCVLDTETGHVGSTAHALLDDAEYESRFRRDLFEGLGIDGEGWFPAGMTAHRGIERLLPDHALDLNTGRFERFWPQDAGHPTRNPDDITQEVIKEVQAQIEALLGGPRRVALALTGGHETRMILACARPYLDKVDIVTVVGEDRHATDTVLARRIVKTMGLRHIELPRPEATANQRALFIRRGGHCNADSNSRYHPSVWPIADTHVFVGGLGGEVGRAFLWRPSDTLETQISVQTLVNRLGLAARPELQDCLGRWLGQLPEGCSAFEVLDLAYHENRNGPWYAAQFCCDPTLVRHAPLMTRGLVEAMMALPPDWKRASRLSHAVTAAAWPELLQFPYNSLGPIQDFRRKLGKVIDDPRRIAKKFRRIFGR